MKINVKKDRIVALRGSWGSGMATLIMENDQVYCENGATVRALEAVFGNVIGEGHTINPNGDHVGKEIYYSLDEMGLMLAAFTPVDQASDELVAMYEKQHKKRRRSAR